MTILPPPTSQLQEVLYELISNPFISVRQMIADTGMLHCKARVLDLRRMGIPIDTELVHLTNTYGRKAKFGQWSIPSEQKEKAVETYLKMIQDEQ